MRKKKRVIALTGADGFIGKNLRLRLSELGHFDVVPLVRGSNEDEWKGAIGRADAVIHLAGVNRPTNDAKFAGNSSSVAQLTKAMDAAGCAVPVILVSSAKATEPSSYGRSKLEAENLLLQFAERNGAPAAIYRLPNVFGKWCRPNYNSAVATFCHNIARDLPIRLDDPSAALQLVYIDDVMSAFIDSMDAGFRTAFYQVRPVYSTTVGELSEMIRGFRDDRRQNVIGDVGAGLIRALYSTYVSYLPSGDFAYKIPSHRDARGTFSEMLKTREAGQFSYFTAFPGVTRGGHYHHTKTEKFLIVHGEARFRFRHVLTGETHEVFTSAEVPCVVETIPGWTHDVTNVGGTLMVSLLWANEVFDRDRPDTVSEPV